MEMTPTGLELFGEKDFPSAIVIRKGMKVEGIQFFSPDSYSQQIGLMTRPPGYRVPPHIHNQVSRNIEQTQEVLLIRKGTCRINLYGEGFVVEHEILLSDGDVILLAHGGHEIIMETECEILEVKQGPYAGMQDKRAINK